MKKWLFSILLGCGIVSPVQAGTVTIFQNAGSSLGQLIISTFTGTSNPPGGFGFLMVSHGPASYGVNAATFTPVGVSLVSHYVPEVQAQIPFHTAGTMSGLWAMVSGNSMTAGTTIQLRIDGHNAAEKVVVQPGFVGEAHDAVDTDTIFSTDTVNYEILGSTSGTTISLTGLAVVYAPITNNMMKLASSNDNTNGSSTNGFATYYTPVGAFANLTDQTETFDSYNVKAAGTFSHLGVYVSTNTRTQGTSTFRLRHNQANGNESITIPQGGTGLFEDNSDQDSVVAGDTVTYQLVMDQGNGSNVLGISFMDSEFVTVGNQMEYFAPTNGHSFNGSDSNIMPIQGALGFDASEIHDYQVLSQVAGTFSNMHVFIRSNSLNQAITIVFRKNQANGNETITIPAGKVGYFEDTTHTDSVAVGDEIDYKETVPAATGTAPFNYLGIVLTHS